MDTALRPVCALSSSAFQLPLQLSSAQQTFEIIQGDRPNLISKPEQVPLRQNVVFLVYTNALL